jgi:hypothetical protein
LTSDAHGVLIHHWGDEWKAMRQCPKQTIIVERREAGFDEASWPNLRERQAEKHHQP